MAKIEKLLRKFDSEQPYHDVANEEEAVNESTKTVFVKTSNTQFYVVIGLLIAGWLATIYYNNSIKSQTNGPLHVYTNSPIPRGVFKPVKKVFNKDMRYVGWSDEVNENWDHLVAGHDSVWIEDPQSYGLPPGEPTPFNHPNMPYPKPHNHYVISSLHSLHCLNMIRFQFFLDKLEPDRPENPEYNHHFWDVHLEHCFEYLRQSISCGGDLMLEGSSAIKIDGNQVTPVTGWGVEHDCINFDLLLSWVNDQEVKYNQTWQSP